MTSVSETTSKSFLQRKFSDITPATTTECGPGTIAFTWNGGPIETTGLVYTESLQISFELIFNEEELGSRIVGAFEGNLEQGVKVELFDARGARMMRLEVEIRDGKYIHADAERGRWAKKRVVCILPTRPQSRTQI